MIPLIPKEMWEFWLIKTPPHSLFAFIGMAVGVLFLIRMGRRQKIHPKIMIIESLWVFAGAWLGSKLLFYIGPYEACSSAGILGIFNRGFVFYGGLFGGILLGYVYTRINRYNFWKHLDFWGMAIPLEIFFARIGCFFVNDALGRITGVWWAVKLPDGTARHPVGLYLSFFNIVLFAHLYSGWHNRRFFGQIFLKYLMVYSAGRFMIEFLREYPFNYLGLTFSQWVSIVVFAVSSAIYLVKSRKV
ncbi:hypothetical protein COV19_07150 [Candidatus Woesearchaeota archaeon CG10_big_fil_rev_8_21_14_0_10_44_13]|nr:MAG: hypothetical protein COV19_07150 [Candidatus Woesearchaeota archaeon CG10_big_fil_rev_8_21_14_0_10_44_13]